MPGRDGTGPPTGARGPRDGHGGGRRGAPGKGSGRKTGGRKGPCKQENMWFLGLSPVYFAGDEPIATARLRKKGQ